VSFMVDMMCRKKINNNAETRKRLGRCLGFLCYAID
jgi:hypothetical protein